MGAAKKSDGTLKRSLLDISRELAEAMRGLSENTKKANAGDSAVCQFIIISSFFGFLSLFLFFA